MKKYVLIVVIIAFIIGILISVYFYNYGEYIVLNSGNWFYEEINMCTENNGISDDEYMIANEETALEIGKAILKEHFPKSYKNIEKNIVVKDVNENWIVYNEIKVSRKYLKKYSFKGGGIYVILYKKTGEVLKIGIDD